ncbi:MAG: malectin domain-containing carbohydrate-binding protein [Verrucomicrobia bacterium]|nr:malectin domain-containing carbohydrate-binding protein [Verrucomicrobiota bacterium]
MRKPALVLAVACACTAQAGQIMVTSDAPAKVRLAAKEVRRYVYLRTGELLPIAAGTGSIQLRVDGALQPQQFRLKSDGKSLTITGGSDIGVLYGAYAFIEKLGVRFYLHGDVIPDGRIPLALPALDEIRQPLFELRGINPWGCHPAGMDAWTADDYKAVFSQLAKMRMNFLGIHTYPDGLPFAEPTVWHGLAGDFDAQGQVKFSYPSHYFSTLASGFQGYVAKKTGNYSFGGSLLFERDDWAPPVMVGQCPQPTTPEGSNEVFNRMAAQFRDAFGFARQVGVKTCLGTETPLAIPKAVQARLKAQGKNPADPAVVRDVYEATFRRIMASHPLDYYWLWTPEGWRIEGTPAQHQATVADIKLAYEALRNVGAPFQLATAGWMLGPKHDRAAFDADLPKDISMSTLLEELGTIVVDPAFGRIKGRAKWAIPWLESDVYQGLAGVQLLAGRMRRDAADAAAYGCTGLMGLQWRTDILAPNISALAQAAWDQNWKPVPKTVWQMEGNIADYPNAKITGTADEVPYRSCRYDLKTIKVKVPNGNYKVTLKFCEPHFQAPAQRVFDVQLQGRTMIKDLDIFAKVGQFAALDFTFDEVAASDGVLTIDLIARKSLPCISAIAVDGPGFTSKLNCGGPASNEWQADTAGNPRNLPCDDFYADWALANFGPEAAADIATIFTRIDGRVPWATADGCPVGPLTPNATPWSKESAQFAFVDDFAKLRARVRGAGNLERFAYWHNTFSYYRLLAEVRCALGAKAPPAEITRLWGETYRHLLASVNTPGALAAVVTMENYPDWGPRVAPHATQPWPKAYQGTPRLIVTTVRSIVAKDEALTLKIIALDNQPMKSLSVKIRPLGSANWQIVPTRHLARAVHEATLPPAQDDFEYHITAETAAGQTLVWPATAPDLNQSVVIH